MSDIGAISANETLIEPFASRCLRVFQFMLDAWAVDTNTLSFQPRTTITWPASTSTQTVGPAGDVNMVRPVYVSQINYVVPGSSPEVEVIIAPMDRDSYQAESIKGLSSALPLSFFYQTTIDTALADLFLWPQPSQQLTLYLYNLQAVPIPTALTDEILAPAGYQEGLLYQLEERLLHPFSVTNPTILSRVLSLSAMAFERMKRPNTIPGLLGVDAALVPSSGGAYNVLTDQQSGFSR